MTCLITEPKLGIAAAIAALDHPSLAAITAVPAGLLTIHRAAAGAVTELVVACADPLTALHIARRAAIKVVIAEGDALKLRVADVVPQERSIDAGVIAVRDLTLRARHDDRTISIVPPKRFALKV